MFRIWRGCFSEFSLKYIVFIILIFDDKKLKLNIMDYRTTEVYKFLIALEHYALGDLKLFHKLADDAEKIEREKEDAERMENECDEVESNDPPTTRYPYSFEFIHGRPSPCRATIPFALMIFSCMDVLGYILKGGDLNKWENKSSFGNIKRFYEEVSDQINPDDLNRLVNLFRHGLAHNYFPKLGHSISYHSKNPQSLFFPDGNKNCLNVNILENHFVEGFHKIKDNESLYELMENNLTYLNKYYEDAKDLLKKNSRLP
jgi:hypothetical protein